MRSSRRSRHVEQRAGGTELALKLGDQLRTYKRDARRRRSIGDDRELTQLREALGRHA
jgi:hypothetical protein